MKKGIKRGLLISGIVVGVIALFCFGFLITLKLEIGKMTPLETKVLFENIAVIKDTYVNVYLVKDDENYIAVDAGDKIENIEAGLKKLDIDPDKVTAVFLTHSDFDHVAAIELFENATIYLSDDEEQMINGTTYRFPLVSNKIKTKDYQLIENHQVLKIGNIRIQGILTPGHTPGSICYLIDDKYLFTGDALSLINGRIERFNNFFNMDSEMASKSIQYLTGIPNVEFIFTAHYGYTDDFQGAVKYWNN